ncbi:DNA primase [Haloprofundus halophilus]|uniref:DNA primase n=1 Tax=Haloprofundus halophilus TaxID=2283527 RepID=UPI0013008558|nr:DNA primase [Haloprofundus halophilus]
MSSRKVTLTFVLVLLCTALAPGVAGALAADAPLDVDVDQSDDTGEATVTVTQNASEVQNATVNVTADGNYTGIGNYTTDENGTTVLPAPESAVNVTLNVTSDSFNATESVELTPSTGEGLSVSVSQGDDGEATVDVTENGTAVPNATVEVAENGNDSNYSGVGNYTTGENGSVSLPEPEENVSVTVTATADNESVNTTTTLTVADEEPTAFGQRVSSFVQSVLGNEDREGGIGQIVSEFVRGNNPGQGEENRPDHAGPPSDKGPNADRGNQSNPGNGSGHGAGEGDDRPGNADGKNASDDGTDGDATETDEASGNGTDGARGNGNGNGNGNGGDSPAIDNGPAVTGPTVSDDETAAA